MKVVQMVNNLIDYWQICVLFGLMPTFLQVLYLFNCFRLLYCF